jgi:lipopolysaccharide export LptBFGC system permease protein LptF
MEPLLDKLARQKAVRKIFETIHTCDKQSDRLAKIRVMRFIVSTICAMVLVFGLFFVSLMFSQYDSQPSYISWPIAFVGVVAVWPFIAVGFIFHGDLPDAFIIPVWIVTGLFWAAVVELFLKLKRRVRSNKSPEPTN